MKILVDADACPVKEIIINKAKIYSIPVFLIVDTSHILSNEYATIITVDKGRDSADIEIANRTIKGDIVVTQDFGVAAMSLGKKAYAISNSGYEYTNENIERLLFERHISQKVRRTGGKTKNTSKRTANDDKHFEEQFIRLIKIASLNF